MIHGLLTSRCWACMKLRNAELVQAICEKGVNFFIKVWNYSGLFSISMLWIWEVGPLRNTIIIAVAAIFRRPLPKYLFSSITSQINTVLQQMKCLYLYFQGHRILLCNEKWHSMPNLTMAAIFVPPLPKMLVFNYLTTKRSIVTNMVPIPTFPGSRNNIIPLENIYYA